MKIDRKKDISPKYLLLTFTVICIVFLLLSYFAGDSLAPIRKVTAKIVTPFQKGVNEIGLWTDSKMKNIKKIDELNKENEELKKELATARGEITTYQDRMTELDSLKKLYALDEAYPDYKMTAAHVFAKTSVSWFSEFYIDKGLDDDLFEGANVMCGEGLCGIVVKCYDDYSKVRAVIDDNSGISGKCIPSSALCFVEGSLSQYKDGYLLVENIDKDAKVGVGDKIVTSDISDRFHPGILIGYISKISEDPNNLTVTAYLTPACDFNNITEVLVITDKKRSVMEE